MNCDPGQSSEADTADYIADWLKWRATHQLELVMASCNLQKGDKMDYNELAIPRLPRVERVRHHANDPDKLHT